LRIPFDKPKPKPVLVLKPKPVWTNGKCGLNVKKNCHSELVTPSLKSQTANQFRQQCRWSIALYPLRNQQYEFYQRDEGMYVPYQENCVRTMQL